MSATPVPNEEPVLIVEDGVEGQLCRGDRGQWNVMDFDFIVVRASFPGELSLEDAEQRARDFMKGYAFGREDGKRSGRVQLQFELRRLIGAAMDPQ